MNSQYFLGKVFAEEIKKIVDRDQTPMQMVIDCKLYVSKDKYEFVIRRLDAIRISQQFTSNYADLIEMTIIVTPTEYIELMKHYQDLHCEVIMTHINPHTLKRGETLYKMNTRFILKNKVDLEQMYPKSTLAATKDLGTYESHQSANITLQCQLIEPEIYTIRKVRMHSILRYVDMDTTIRYVADLMGVTKTSIVPPDNKKNYENMIIPPMLDITDIFDFLQNGSGKGVYNKGLGYYFTRGVMYIYPLYETAVTTPKVVNIYHTTRNLHQGMYTYHRIDGDNIHILNNQEVEYKDYTEEGLENAASDIIMARGEQMIDKWRNVVEGRKFDIPLTNTELVSATTKKGVVDNVFTPKYALSKENPYQIREEILREQIAKVTTSWPNALPFTFKPGWKVSYHTDAAAGYRKQDGIPANVIYTIDKIGRPDSKENYLYACSCTFTLHVTP